MNLLHVTDLGNGHVQVSWQRGKTIPRQSPRPIPFTDPLSMKDRSELRWYLEEYLQFPYGAERWRADQIERKMAEWGESLFRQVFAKADLEPDPRTLYQEAVREGLEHCELCISSEDPAFLNIPWELIRDPTPGRGYLAPLLGGLYRQRTGHKIEESPELSAEELFRILLVIARPYGKRDIPLGTVARPMLKALRQLRPRIHLEVLRPPTFDALQKHLNERRGFYHLVHFDGHGVFAAPSQSPFLQYGAIEGRGHLAFEKEDGTEDIVNSQDLGQLLATSKVPLFVVNACQSAEEGKADPFSSVASQLVSTGAKGVVAMSYSVYASAAATFMERFYEELVRHASLSEAVAAARRSLYANPGRESVVGAIELRDWMVPTLYQQEYRYVPIPEETGLAAAEEDVEEVVLRQRAEEVCPEGRFGFIGRDYDILRIERALREDSNPWVLLTGLGGTGKTELAFGFARWYAETGGCPGGVFAASFKEKADFGQVIGSIVGYGTDFSRLPEAEQWQRLVDCLRDNPSLLIWDNFEPVAGYPHGTVPLATDEARAKLSRFLKTLRGGKSRVLITTRKPDEEWLGIAYEPIEVTGLTYPDAAQLAKAILRTVGRRPEDFRDDPNYARLLKLLRGHPRSLEVVLPHLRRRSPRELIDAIEHRIDSLGEALGDASLGYAFLQMSSRTRRHLPLIGLFASYVHVDTLGTFVAAGDEQQQVYADIVGEVLDVKGWETVLEEAGRSGLIRPLGSRLYELHPTLSPFLRRQLLSMAGEDGLRQLDLEFMKFYGGWVRHYLEDVRKIEPHALAAATVEEANLLRALRFAEMNEEWKDAQVIIETLDELYKARGRTDEWVALRVRMLDRVGMKISVDAPQDRADLCMYLLGDAAGYALEHGELSVAEDGYRRIQDYLVSLHDPTVEPKLAVTYHQLGLVAQKRHHFNKAEELYGKALEICDRLGLEQDVAEEYFQFGRVAQDRHQLDKADEWYGKALEIFDRLELKLHTARAYFQLARVAEMRYQFDKAEEWFRKALEVFDRLGLKGPLAKSYHQLGVVAGHRHQFDNAEQWYRKALETYQRLGQEQEAATEYHALGNIALVRGHSQEAEQWYRKALEIFERPGLEREAASAYHQLGMVAQARQGFKEADKWYRKALEIFERLGHPPLLVNTLAQLGILHRDQNQLDEAVLWFGRALVIAAQFEMQVGDAISMDLARIMSAMGEDEFVVVWRQAFEDQEPPLPFLRDLLDRGEEDST